MKPSGIRVAAGAAPVLLLLLVGAGCGPQVEEVKARLAARTCDGASLGGVFGVWVALARRGSFMLLEDCRDTHGGYDSLDELEGKLAQVSLGSVSEEGLWDLWVVGTDRDCCLSQVGAQVRLCGALRGIAMPPPGNQLDVSIDCLDPLSGGKGAAADGVKDCVVGQPALSPHRSCGP